MQKTIFTFLLLLVLIATSAYANTLLKQAQGLIDKHGKADLMDFILQKSPDFSVTVQVGKKLYIKSGRQDTNYITVNSVAYDLKRLRLPHNQTENDISAVLEKKAEKSKRMNSIISEGRVEKISNRPVAKAISIVEIANDAIPPLAT